MENYIRRTLAYFDKDGAFKQLQESEIVSYREPLIVLGEPGMGKTTLLRHLAAENGWNVTSALSFLAHPNPKSLAAQGQRILIDGLDEISAIKESAPLHQVLGQLIEAGSPPFMLSCRAADWRGISLQDSLLAEYTLPPRELTLEPFSRVSAIAFLEVLLGLDQAVKLIGYLEDKGIPDIYGNPLTLGLFGEVALSDRLLPSTRAELLARACEIMWSERNDNHEGSALANLGQASALASAGAICAALVLTGSEGISFKPSTKSRSQIIRGSELCDLPDGLGARSVASSRLFVVLPGTTGEFKPIHRAVAEFLGARWLSRVATDGQIVERIFAMFNHEQGVPASLRGLHAWLGLDPRFMEKVILTDPYGVLRYGDADGLSIEGGRNLLFALARLQEVNPYFRAEDWGRHTAKGLTHIELLQDFRSLLVNPKTTTHLKTLLLQILRGSLLSKELRDDLEKMVFNTVPSNSGYATRRDALDVLIDMETEEASRWEMIERLCDIGDDDSTRLAMDALAEIGFGCFQPNQILRVVFGYLGINEKSGASLLIQRHTVGILYRTAEDILDSQIPAILDGVVRHFQETNVNADAPPHYELAQFITRLIARKIKSGSPEPLRLLSWLQVIPLQSGYLVGETHPLNAFLENATSLRHAIQREIIFVRRSRDHVSLRLWDLREISPALQVTADDAVYFLRELARQSKTTEDDLAIWRELASFTIGQSRPPQIEEAARLMLLKRPELEKVLLELARPPVMPAWQMKHVKMMRRRELARAKLLERQRNCYASHRSLLQVGDTRWICDPARSYLGMFSDIDLDLSPPDRIGSWLGHELQQAALDGFDAVLAGSNLPTSDQIADGYAQSQVWNLTYAMMAGVAERVRLGRDLSDLNLELVLSVRLAFANESLVGSLDLTPIIAAIDAVLESNFQAHERYIRALIEPWLKTRQQYVPHLHSFLQAAENKGLAAQLSAEWLEYNNLSTNAQTLMIDVLVDAKMYSVLQALMKVRETRGYTDQAERWVWLSVGILTDFSEFPDEYELSPEDKDFIWYIRDRFHGPLDTDRSYPTVNPNILRWIIHNFRPVWKKIDRPLGVTTGNSNDYDAYEFLQRLINQLERDPSDAATAELARLLRAPHDGYTVPLAYAVDQQRRLRREMGFHGITLDQLKVVVTAQPPRTTDDLLATIGYALQRLQKELRGSDTDVIGKYYRDDGRPQSEDYCTDRLIEDVQRLLPNFGIGSVPQRDMPNNKRADIVFTVGEVGLPVECKGQWNRQLWSAAADQLDAYYLRDWRSQDRGLYIVYWFGNEVSSHYRATSPKNIRRASSAEELRAQILGSIAPLRQANIKVKVLDFSRPVAFSNTEELTSG